jgi:hypothetical protein
MPARQAGCAIRFDDVHGDFSYARSFPPDHPAVVISAKAAVANEGSVSLSANGNRFMLKMLSSFTYGMLATSKNRNNERSITKVGRLA